MKKIFILTIIVAVAIFATGFIPHHRQESGVSASVINVSESSLRGDGPNTLSDPANGHEYVDLGLRKDGKKILFATMNVGASSETEYGDYFAFGETSKIYFRIIGSNVVGGRFGWASTPYSNDSGTKITKYTAEEDSHAATGTADGLTTLDSSDDVASVLWGGFWRMPDKSDLEFLISSSVDYEWVSNYNGIGINGLKVTGKGEFSSSVLFVPAAGCCYDSSRGLDGNYSYYWSRCIDPDNPYYAYGWYFEDGFYCMDHFSRCNGLSVRPVLVLSELRIK